MMMAFVRLALISVGSLTLILLGLVAVRWAGYQQSFAAPPHPWFAQSEWKVLPAPADCPDAARVSVPTPDWIVLLNIKFKEGEWRLDCKPSDVKMSETKRTPTIHEVLAATRHNNWMFNVEAVETNHLDNLVDIVSPEDQTKKFAVVSESQRVSRYLRKKAPQWLYASDAASLLRMQLFTSLWIETAMDFWPDFVMAGRDVALPSHLSVRLAQELVRRNKRIIWQDENSAPPADLPTQGRIAKPN